jgi:endonuclease-3 related protein
MVGAILTQNTSWRNVERAIDILKVRGLLTPRALGTLSPEEIAPHIRSAGYYNIKARRLRAFLDYFLGRHNGEVERMREVETGRLREELLAIRGVGQETADSILLYAVGKPIFVVDAYTKRILERLGFLDGTATYDHVQRIFMDALPRDVQLYNEYHATLVRLGHSLCRKGNPRCQECPLIDLCSFGQA